MENTDILSEIREDFKHPKRKKKEIVLKKEKKPNIINKIKFMFLMLIFAVAGVAYAAEWYVDWRAGHEWQFPAKWIGLVRTIENKVLNPVEAKETKKLTDKEIIDQYYLAPVIHSIYMLESTEGKNDGCKDEGKFNGYGYRQNGSEWKCYDTFEEVTGKVNEWLEERLLVNGNNLTEAICFYNKGLQYQSTCGDYSENFWSVLTKYF